MKHRIIFRIMILYFAGALFISPANAGFNDILDSAKKALGSYGGVTESEMVEGLKEALEIGTKNSVELVSKPNGYYKNSNIKIPLPENSEKVANLLRMAGYGSELDAFELSMNRAAEQAAPEAKGIFWEAIKEMNITDAKKILDGRDNEATMYFKDHTYQRLEGVFKPIVTQSMGEVGVTRKYQDLNAKVEQIPFADPLSFDLDQYVTDGALKGLFFMLAEEEKRIRQDPAARVTDLLKKVFGHK